MDLRTINTRIKHIARSTASMNAYVQDTAVGIIEHAQATGDCTAALRLVQALPKSYRRALLINWFGRYSPIGMNVNQGKVGLHRPDARLYNPYNVEAAKANPWFEGVEADNEQLPDTTLEDARKKIFGVANGLQKKIDAGEVAAEDRDNVVDLVARLKELGRREFARPAPAAEAPAAPAAAVTAA